MSAIVSDSAVRAVKAGRLPSPEEALALAGFSDVPALSSIAEDLCLAGHGTKVTFSKKVFIPLTKLCRDVCHYCTFAEAPRQSRRPYLLHDDVLEIARSGAGAGCKEALFTLGDKPELRYEAARDALAALGHATTHSYLEACARLVVKETGLLPHLNPGVMDEDTIKSLRDVSVSQGLMLESASDRLCSRGGPHFGSPDKLPAARLATLQAAGEAQVPFTTGILIGIGETRRERIEALIAIRELNERYGHIQEIIIQNFRAKPGTRMAEAPEPSVEDHVWTVAVSRIIFGPEMNIQAPPNLRPDGTAHLIRSGINDWGGVSPVTPDHVNPELPWPHLDALEEVTRASGRILCQRLAIYPAFAAEPERWLAEPLRAPVLDCSDSAGLAREDTWHAGSGDVPPPESILYLMSGPSNATSTRVERILARAENREDLDVDEIECLFGVRGPDFGAVCQAADRLRSEAVGDVVTYVVTRNINYTNVCTYGCRFCAFSKGRLSTSHRDRPYNLELDEIACRTQQAWERGATEVCLQGGIRPGYTGETYLDIVAAVKDGTPHIHVHAFSPLEVWHGAHSLGMDVSAFLKCLRQAGLASLPGTAAEILDDEVRAVLCADKITTAQWLEVMASAHEAGLRSTATIMFGHVDRPCHWARHLVRVRDLQRQTGGFTEFVPLPFVHMEAPIYLKGEARMGPTFREAVLMHAVARLVLFPYIKNIQASWVKLGPEGAAVCLNAGVNDIGGTLMNESITRAAGATYGQELAPREMERLIRGSGRVPMQRTTLYEQVAAERYSASHRASDTMRSTSGLSVIVAAAE